MEQLEQGEPFKTLYEGLSAFLENHSPHLVVSPLLRLALNQSSSGLALLCIPVEAGLRMIALEASPEEEANHPEFHADVRASLENLGYVEIPGQDNLFGIAVKTTEVVIVNSAATDPRFSQIPGRPGSLHSFMGIPLRRGPEVVGCLCVANRDGGYSADHLGQFAMLSALMCVFCDSFRRQWQISKIEKQFGESRRMEALGQLAGGVAHEYSNVIQSIVGNAEVLERELGPSHPRQREVREIRLAAERGAALTRQLLAYTTQPVRGDHEVNLNTILEEMHPMLERLIREDIRVVMLLNPGLGTVSMDPSQFQQVVLNLAANAAEAMAHGGRITIRTANADYEESSSTRPLGLDPGQYATVTVSDTGAGMDADVQARIFEPFFTTKGDSGRTGLGLSVVQNILRQCGGEIVVSSQVGHGTRFTIFLPRKHTYDATQILTPAELLEGDGRGETVLLVEDEDAVRNLAQRLLERSNYHVVTAMNGVHALEVAEAHSGPIDLLLTDVIMPEMGGKDLAQRLYVTRPSVKVLYMSGYSGTTVHKAGVRDASQTYLQKPFRPSDLLRKVREVLDAPQQVA